MYEKHQRVDITGISLLMASETFSTSAVVVTSPGVFEFNCAEDRKSYFTKYRHLSALHVFIL